MFVQVLTRPLTSTPVCVQYDIIRCEQVYFYLCGDSHISLTSSGGQEIAFHQGAVAGD